MEDKYKGFEEVVKPVMEWLKANTNPHTKIIIEDNSAELVVGEKVLSN
jgi:hypothetical protein